MYYKVAGVRGQRLTWNKAGASGSVNEVYVRYGECLPGGVRRRGATLGQASQFASVSNNLRWTYYVMVYGATVQRPRRSP